MGTGVGTGVNTSRGSGKLGWRRVGRFAAAVAATAASGTVATLPRAAQGQAVWIGGEGTWNTPGQWDTGTVPNSPAVDVSIDAGNPDASVVTLDIAPSIRALTLDADDSLVFNPGQTLSLFGGGTVNGTIHLGGSDGSGYGYLRFFSDYGTPAAQPQALGGAGTILLGASASSQLSNQAYHLETVNGQGTNVGDEATIGPGVTVRGAGSIVGQGNGIAGQRIVNQGLITADAPGRTLTVSDVRNLGVLRAENGGTLNLGNITPASLGTFSDHNGASVGTVALVGTLDNTGGTLALTAATGSIRLAGGTVRGGTVTGAGGSRLAVGSGTLDGVTVGPGAVAFVDNGATLLVRRGLTLAGGAEIDMAGGDPASRYGYLVFQSDVSAPAAQPQVLGGAGTILLGATGSSGLSNQAYHQEVVGGNGVNVGDEATIGSGVIVRGAGSVAGRANGIAGQRIVNLGLITADAPGRTLTVSDVLNQGAFEASGGGTLSVSAGLSNLTGTTLTGGIFKAGTGSIIQVVQGNVVINAADVILSGAGSSFQSGSGAGTPTGSFALESTMNRNQGVLRFLDGRSYTSAIGAMTNTGQIELGGGTYTPVSGANSSLNNTAPGTLYGFGTVARNINNTGTVRAQGGTLAARRITGAGGTVEVAAGATLDLTAATGDSSADFLTLLGTATGGLNLGANSFRVDKDYTNAGFGVGNGFNPRANVAGAGAIQAGGTGVGQSVTGDVTNGTSATPTLTFGNVHVGDAVTRNFAVNNLATAGAALRGAIQTAAGGGNVTDARLSGTGVTAANFGPIQPGAAGPTLAVTFTATTAGPLAAGQAIRVVNNFDNVADQTVQIAPFAAYRLAAPGPHAPEPVTFGNRHVGDATTLALTLANAAAADGFSEALDASLGSPTGGVTATGSVAALAPGATNNTGLVVGIDTSSAGNKGGTATLSLVSNGAGSSGLGTTNLPAQTVNVTGSVYRLAAAQATPATVNLGNVHVGDTATRALTVSNVAVADGFSEALDASLGSPTGGVTASGSVAALAPGATNSSSLVVGIDTASAGNKGGTAVLSLVSNGAGSSGLGTTNLPSQTINVTGSVYRLAAAQAAPTTVNLGIVHVGDTATRAITVSNVAVADGFSEGLNAAVGTPTVGVTAAGAVTQIAAGASNATAVVVGIDTGTAGARSGSVPLNLTSTGTGTSGLGDTLLAGQVISVQGQVNNYAAALIALAGGPATLAQDSPTSYTLDLGTLDVGAGDRTVQLVARNDVAAPADTLAGTFVVSVPAAFVLAGFDPFAGVAAGGERDGLSVTLDDAAAGTFAGVVTLSPRSQNAGGFDGALGDVVLSVRGQVIPEPSTAGVLAAGAGLLAATRRRRTVSRLKA